MENVCHARPPPRNPRNPRVSVRLGWTITKINTCTHFNFRLTQRSPAVNTTIPMLYTSPTLLKYCNQVSPVLNAPHSSTKETSSPSCQSQCITNTNTVRQQLCRPPVRFLSISDCDQSFRSAHLMSCNQSDSTK